MMFNRRKTSQIQVGKVGIGSNFPISVQSMTTTKTRDVDGTLAQIYEIASNGADIVRVTCNEVEAAEGLVEITQRSPVPIIADIHFQYKLALAAIDAGVDGLRLNPGNIRKESQIKEVAKAALSANIPIRIGVNGGSLDKDLLEKYGDATPEALVESAMTELKYLEDVDFFNIKISVKHSNVPLMIESYRLLAEKVDYPLHLGVTEAGPLPGGLIKSTAGISTLLNEGIGDTIRVSLTPDKMGVRTKEVEVCKDILSSLDIKQFKPKVISCPGCGRTSSNYFIDLAKDINKHIEINMIEWKAKYKNIENINIAVMGCIVNGPGESKHANIGISLPGTNESPSAPVYIDGEKTVFCPLLAHTNTHTHTHSHTGVSIISKN